MAAFQHRSRQPGAALAQNAAPRIIAFEPIPAGFQPRKPPPYRMELADLLTPAEVQEIAGAGRMTFHCIGDSGGVKHPEPQALVARGLELSLQPQDMAPSLRSATMSPAFCYHVGDVVYYNGEVTDYWDQFYEPYEHYPLPIFGLPGNHDAELLTPQSVTLQGFYENFVAAEAGTFTHESRDSGRPAMHQPYFYWTLKTPFATIVGLYTNVPEHGRIDDAQRAWFHAEMKAADPDKALVVALHHPVYSFDSHHSGSPNMAKELEDAINASRRLPNMVLSAHVHNYQRIEVELAGHTVPIFVIGNGGYWNLHHLQAAIGYRDPETEAVLKAGIDSRHGFMTFEISERVINGHFTTVPRPQESWTDPNAYNANFDVFSYSALPLRLEEGQSVTLVPPHGTNVPAHTHHDRPPPHRTGVSQERAVARSAHAARTAARATHPHALAEPAADAGNR